MKNDKIEKIYYQRNWNGISIQRFVQLNDIQSFIEEIFFLTNEMYLQIKKLMEK